MRYAWLALAAYILYSIVRVFMPSFDDGSKMPEGPAGAYADGDSSATRYRSPAVATAERAVTYWVQEIADGYHLPRVKDAPATLVAAPLHESCALYAPSEEAMVVFVEIYGGEVELPLYLIEQDDIRGLAKYVQSKGKSPPAGRILNNSKSEQVDIFVTETERPVYLVLAAYDSILWSLQLAEGARVDGVAVIAYEAQALAHAPEGTPVRFIVFDNSPQRGCIVIPARAVPDSAYEPAGTNDSRLGDYGHRKLVEREIEHRKYRRWLEAKVGQPDVVIAASSTSHVLIGPKPPKKIPYRHLTGSRVLYTPTVTPVWANRMKAADAVDDMVKRTAAAAPLAKR